MNWKKTLINKNSTINDAIKVINNNISKTAIIIDRNQKILGLISDGDIRRAIIRKKKLLSKAIDIATKDPFVVPSNIGSNKIKEIMKSNNLFAIPVVNKNKKVIGLYDWNSLSNFNFKINNYFLIMAGGFGKRLLPLTKNDPKPLLKIENIPIIERIIVNAKNYGFINFIISTHYLSGKIKKFCGSGKKWGVKITYIDEKIDDIEMNYAFSGKFRGKGYGVGIATGLVKFAFEQLNLDKLDGETLSYNSASQYLLRKIGMQSEDIKSSSNFKDTYSNVYSITKDQYECHVHKNNIAPNHLQ